MIPSNISRDHVLNAIKKIDGANASVPKGRDSKKFKLFFKGKSYPPKYVISIANRYANGRELEPSIFSGGKETNNFLGRLGFEIREIGNLNSIDRLSKSNPTKKEGNFEVNHNERCSKCKETIGKMLGKIYGRVETNYKFKGIGVCPDGFIGHKFYKEIEEIFSSLNKFRGRKNFVCTSTLPNVDYYVPFPGFIVEFDESQHFTALRKESLLNYPNGLELGFNRDKWIKLCEKIDAKDNDPAYRDEQRAWYDTLRDFLPSVLQLNPTIRLYSKDMKWCELNSDMQSDIDNFKKLLEVAGARIVSQPCNNALEIEEPQFEIIIRRDPSPTLARIVIKGEWDGDVNTSKKLLKEICCKWPDGEKVNCLITCGGFLKFEWPNLSIDDIRDNKNPSDKAVSQLKSEAQKQCSLLIDEELRKELNAYTDYITIGIDSQNEKISFSSTKINQHHIELVALIDLKTGRYYWTGKSYPTIGQENGLVRIQDVKTHFLDLSFGKVMILGCHDLTLFNPRSIANTKADWRIKIRNNFFEIIRDEKPDIVLQHPHTTESPRTWNTAWSGLKKRAPTVKNYISAGRYFNCDQGYPILDKVLRSTKVGNTIDFIVEYK